MWRMAKSFFEWGRAGKVCSFKSATISICLFNLLLAIYVLHSLCVFSSYPSDVWHAIDQAKRVEESAVVRRALGHVEFFRLVGKLRADTDVERRVLELSSSVKRKLADEILQRLRTLGDSANLIELREVLGTWLVEKLKALKQGFPVSNVESSMVAKEAKLITDALESDWVKLLEDIGIWIPSVVNNYEIDDRPKNATEDEENSVPGPPFSPECRAEPHTDYDGAAIRWGLTHHKETAADCCQACIDQAKHAKVGQIKCNIWVYCPSEFGCYSPDIYEHRYQECWLKQIVAILVHVAIYTGDLKENVASAGSVFVVASMTIADRGSLWLTIQAKKPRLNFKDKYSETYRDSHPTAPVAVPWISGVIS